MQPAQRIERRGQHPAAQPGSGDVEYFFAARDDRDRIEPGDEIAKDTLRESRAAQPVTESAR